MKFVSQFVITGMKASKGAMENGTAYDSTKVYVQTDLDDSKGNAKGSATAEYTFGKSDEYDHFKHLPFPFKAECEVEIVTNGKSQKTVLRSIKPVSVPKAQAQAQ